MRRRGLRRWFLGIAAVAVVAVGLAGVGRGAGRPEARRPATPSVPPAAPSAGATLPVGQPQIVNATRGAVPEATAQAWAMAYLASVHWTVEAVDQERTGLLDPLYAPGQADPATVGLINDARAAGAHLSYLDEPRVTRLILVVLTGDQQAAIRGDGGSLSGPYAWVVTWTGPTDLLVRWPGGRVDTDAVLRAGAQITELSAGAVVEDPVLGGVWRESASRDCTAHPDPVLCPY